MLTAMACAKNVKLDFSEEGTGMKELVGDRFIADLKYNSADNFLKKNVYKEYGLDKCYVHPDLHSKLKELEKVLIEKKLKLVLFDCYRPLQVQEEMWKLIPNERYVADPKKGSNHNRGVAMDCALADESGKVLKFPTEFDDFTEKAAHTYQCSAEESQLCKNREVLHSMMMQIGLEAYPTEWWHYQLPNASKYPIVQVHEVLKKSK